MRAKAVNISSSYQQYPALGDNRNQLKRAQLNIYFKDMKSYPKVSIFPKWSSNAKELGIRTRSPMSFSAMIVKSPLRRVGFANVFVSKVNLLEVCRQIEDP